MLELANEMGLETIAGHVSGTTTSIKRAGMALLERPIPRETLSDTWIWSSSHTSFRSFDRNPTLFLGVPIRALPRTTDVLAVLYRRGNRRYLIVINTGEEEKGVEIVLDASEFPGDRYVARDLLDHEDRSVVIYPDRQRAIHIFVARKNGVSFEISPAYP
jgi:hypothetical protein